MLQVLDRVTYNNQTYIIQSVEEVPFVEGFEELACFLTQSCTVESYVKGERGVEYQPPIQLTNVRIQSVKSISSQTQNDVLVGGFMLMYIPNVSAGLTVANNTHLEVIFK